MPEAEKSEGTFTGDLASLGGLEGAFGLRSPVAVQRYNDALAEYYADYERYYTEHAAWLDMLRRTATVALEIVNDGSATATNIDVTLRFPETVTVMLSRDWAAEPEAPKAPFKPGTDGAAMGMPRNMSALSLRSFDLHVHDGAMWFDRQNRWAGFSYANLKRKCVLAVDKMLLTRGVALPQGGIEVEVEITYHEGEPVE